MNAFRSMVQGTCLAACLVISSADSMADGTVRGPASYAGSLEEKSQEAILIFNPPVKGAPAIQDMILKISVVGDVSRFAWVVPFPNEPEIHKASSTWFRELFDHIEIRQRPQSQLKGKKGGGFGGGGGAPNVEVLSRRSVGSYDVAVVKENVGGTLNRWLEEEGYQPIEYGEDVIEFYRQRGYVFCCIKVDNAQLNLDEAANLHPLRFTFDTGGRDGIYFPMKLTGLQKESFNVILYVFSTGPLEDTHRKYGHDRRHFFSKYRGRKRFPLESVQAPSFSRLLFELHPRTRFYLTKLRARGMKPEDVRAWDTDLWLFPSYRNRRFVPYDARRGGPAFTAAK